MKTKISVLIDAGYMKKVLEDKKVFYNEIAINNIVKECIDEDEELHKVLYYDCKSNKKFNEANIHFRNDELLDKLSKKGRYAVRLGNLKHIGYSENKRPLFVQKGVDIRIALDVAKIIMTNKINRILLISGDTDLIPAMKMARIHDIEVGLVHMTYLAEELYHHMDFIKDIKIDSLLESGKLKKFTPNDKKTN